MMTVQPTNQRDLYRAGDDEAERRHVVKQRAVELKRALLESTLRLSPERAAVAYNEAVRAARHAKLRSVPVLRLCVALLSGALSMLVPIPRTCSLPGQLTMAEPSQSALSNGTTIERRALVHAHFSECARLSVDERAALFIDRSGAEALRIEGTITRLAPRAGSGDAACQIELQLLCQYDEAQALRKLPDATPLTAVVPMHPSNWLAVLADKAASEDGFHQASSALKGVGERAAQRSVALVEYLRNSENARQHWETLRQIFAPDEQ